MDTLTIEQAIDFIHANLAQIGSEALLHNRLALEVSAAYARYAQRPGAENAASVVKAAGAWADWQAGEWEVGV